MYLGIPALAANQALFAIIVVGQQLLAGATLVIDEIDAKEVPIFSLVRLERVRVFIFVYSLTFWVSDVRTHMNWKHRTSSFLSTYKTIYLGIPTSAVYKALFAIIW
jgi:hypothetical protein